MTSRIALSQYQVIALRWIAMTEPTAIALARLNLSTIYSLIDRGWITYVSSRGRWKVTADGGRALHQYSQSRPSAAMQPKRPATQGRAKLMGHGRPLVRRVA